MADLALSQQSFPRMKFLNTIEKIVRHLPNMDEDLAHAAQAIEAKLQASPDHRAVQEERDVLLARVKLRYSAFEMTAAEAHCNRLNESGLWPTSIGSARGRIASGWRSIMQEQIFATFRTASRLAPMSSSTTT